MVSGLRRSFAPRKVDRATGSSILDLVDQTRSAGRSAPLLAMTGLVKRFTGTLALDRVDFDVHRGEVHALLGQNGAGKSTLIKVLAGVYQADAGDIVFDGKPSRPGADALPIAFIHQDLGLVEWMTIAENVAIQTGYPRSRAGVISWPRVNSAAAEGSRSRGAISIRRHRSLPSRPPSAPWSRSAGRWRSSLTSSFSTSRPRRFPRPTSNACSRRCDDCAPATSALSM